jgi:hypothetical protein
LFDTMGQSTACNNLHPVEQRLCRWLLMMSDRVGSGRFPLTQEFMAQMLGVRKASTVVIAGILNKEGLITYQRGIIEILDRPGVEKAACECYFVVQEHFDRLLGRGLPLRTVEPRRSDRSRRKGA